MQKGFVISRPGEAGPSPAQRLSAAVRSAAPSGEIYAIANDDAAPRRRGAGVLTGLIRRRAPIRRDPVQAGAEYPPAAAAPLKARSIDLARIASASAILPDFESGPPPKPSAPPRRVSGQVTPFGLARRRRQLTVRLGMTLFDRLDRVARSTGRTYQDIQAKAIDRYLGDCATGAPVAAVNGQRDAASAPVRPPLFGRLHRRQLTVRLESALFERFDRVAKSTGRTYQDIQARAIERYLEELAAEDGRGADKTFRVSTGANANDRTVAWPIRANRGICIQGDSRILAREFQSMSSA